MEVSGVVPRPLQGGDATHLRLSSSSFAVRPSLFSSGNLRRLSLMPPTKRSPAASNLLLRVSTDAPSSGFCDSGHVEYYAGPTPSATKATDPKVKELKEITSKNKTMKKKKLKLLKDLSKNLSTFSDMGFGLLDHPDPDHGLVHQVKGKMIPEAVELLLVQLQQLRAEEMELKRKKKEQKAKLNYMQMQTSTGCEDSSSSSSESSDSECGEEVVDMSCRMSKRGCLASNGLQPAATVSQEATKFALPSMTAEVIASNTQILPNNGEERGLHVVASGGSSQVSNQNCFGTSSVFDQSNIGCHDRNGIVVEASAKKIEVCMGGKCKKSGAALLMDEFQKAVGGEGAGAVVVGCKCMGKCRDGPNVRVTNAETETQRLSSSNPLTLCIGVGLEDVGSIVSNLFGGNLHSQVGLAQPAAS